MVTHLGDNERIGKGRMSGRETLAAIEQAIQDLRAKETDLQGVLEKLTSDRAGIVEERLKVYRELAEVRARNAVADGVIDEADRLSFRVANLLSARQRTIDDLKQRHAEADRNRARLVTEREGLLDRIDKLEKRLDQLALQAREALSSDAGYRADIEALEGARGVHAKAAEKARRAHEDRQTKGRAYESDPLFMYLWRRKYADRDYQAGGIVKMLDGWVARLVKYHEARANYAVLNEIPVRLDAHVGRLADDLAQKRRAVETRETAKIRELAHADIASELRTAREAEETKAKAIEHASAELSDVGEQINKYAEGLDPAFSKAVEFSAEFLSQEDTNRLIAVARQTPAPTDDDLANRIAGFDRRVADISAERDRKTQELEKLFEKRDELLRIAADFRRAHYDDAASEFRGRDIAGVILTELLRGAISGAEYWARTRRRQRWRSRPADPYRRSQNFPPFDFDFDDMFDLDDMFDFDDDDFRSGGGF